MHQVLQRTRPAQVPSAKPASKLRTFLRSFLAGRRGLVLLALVGGAALTSQTLHGLLRPQAQPAPGTPAGADGVEEAAASGEPADPSAPAVARPAATGAASSASPGRAAAAASASTPSPPTSSAPTSSARAALTTALGPGGPPASPATPAAARPAQPARSWPRSSASRPDAAGGPDVIAEPWPDGLPGPVPAAAPPSRPARSLVRGQAAVRQLGTVTLSDLDPLLGDPCSDTTAALPSGRAPEEAWLPGSDASSASLPDALDPIPVPPIYSESPDRAAGPSSPSLSATRNTPCLPKQPAGRN